MTRFRDVECNIVKCPLLREDWAVRDVVTVVLVLLFVVPIPKQWCEFVGHQPEIQEIACVFLSSNNCCLKETAENCYGVGRLDILRKYYVHRDVLFRMYNKKFEYYIRKYPKILQLF